MVHKYLINKKKEGSRLLLSFSSLLPPLVCFSLCCPPFCISPSSFLSLFPHTSSSAHVLPPPQLWLAVVPAPSLIHSIVFAIGNSWNSLRGRSVLVGAVSCHPRGVTKVPTEPQELGGLYSLATGWRWGRAGCGGGDLVQGGTGPGPRWRDSEDKC